MIYKFRILCDEIDEFIRVFEVPARYTFYDFHLALQKELGYDTSQIASFFISNERWDKLQEFTLADLVDIEDNKNEVTPMENAMLNDFLHDKKDRLLYIFDVFSERSLFIELVDIIDNFDEEVDYPVCTYSAGNAPQQILIDDFNFDDMYLNEE